MAYTYKYPRPSVAVDAVLFGYQKDSLQVLLIRRGLEPFKNTWAIPGGFMKMDETPEQAAQRELREETGVEHSYMEQLATFGAVNRDPRERVLSITYFALVDLNKVKGVKGGTDADEAKWFDIKKLPPLAFDHKEILAAAIERLRAKITYQPIVFELLPEKFVFSQLENIYETILQEDINRRNFRTKMMATGLVEELDEYLEGVSFRPPKLFRFNRKKFNKKKVNEVNLRF